MLNEIAYEYCLFCILAHGQPSFLEIKYKDLKKGFNPSDQWVKITKK